MFLQTSNCVNVPIKLSKNVDVPQDQEKHKNDPNFFSIGQKCPYKLKKK
jgi:hypothetical protein